jgi:GNAT superfamily N-acetyltransferase
MPLSLPSRCPPIVVARRLCHKKDREMPISLRPIDPATDFPRMAEILNTARPDPLTAQILHEWETQTPAGLVRQRTAAVDASGQIAGVGRAEREPWMEPGRFWLSVVVAPDQRRQGIGARLYDGALRFAREHGAASLEGEIRDDSPEALRFATARGFRIRRHLFESTLDLATFDEAPFAGSVAAAEAAGIRFFTLADLGDTEEAQRRLYALNRRLAHDIVGRDDTFAPFEDFRKSVCGASWYRADGEIVAADGDAWIGMAAVGYFAATNSMYNMMTGVDAPYRGRGLALALKLLAIRCAQRYGAAYIRTNNDEENAPMLAVNRKLGYQSAPGKYLLICDAL